MNEYMIIYLNNPNEVTKAHRPSKAKCLMQLIFSSLDVNGAATDASACSIKSFYYMFEFFISIFELILIIIKN